MGASGRQQVRQTSSGPVCKACARPAGAGMVICASCGDKIADNLVAVPDLVADLAITFSRQDVLTEAAGRGGEVGLPFVDRASETTAELAAAVLRWAQAVAMVRSNVWELPNDLAALALWLRYRIDWLRAMDSAAEAYVDIDRVITRARRVVDRPQNRTSFPVGKCGESIDQQFCSGDVYALIPTRIGVDPAVLKCRNPECARNHTPWPVESWRAAGKSILRRKDIEGRRRWHT
jgi:hypothetical protein